MRVHHGLWTKLQRSDFFPRLLIDSTDLKNKIIITYIEMLTLINQLKEHPVLDSELFSLLKCN